MNSVATSQDAIAFVLAQNASVQTLRFFKFSTRTKLQQRRREFDSGDAATIERALKRKAKEGLRFWEALLSDLVKEERSSRSLLSEVFYHQANRDYQYVERAAYGQFASGISTDGIALNSKVLINDGSSRHMALLDFKMPSKIANHKLAEDCVRALGLRGFLIDSGRSYHFMGIDLVTESALLDLLSKFALLHPISDMAWAAHQLLERSASLRVSERSGKAPSIIRRVGID
jgi:hypothetical protein